MGVLWTTDAQAVLLKSYIPEFLSARLQSKNQNVLSKVDHEFAQRWPLRVELLGPVIEGSPPLTEEEKLLIG